MNNGLSESRELAAAVAREAGAFVGPVDVAVCPPYVSLAAVSEAIAGSGVRLGAQNMSDQDSGAFTGEVSAHMLKSAGCTYVILGHSERRLYFGETDQFVNRKVMKALSNQLVPIVCVGETIQERNAGDENAVVERQVRGALAEVSVAAGPELVIAYEPVWAIGTGLTATPEQAQRMHAFIRGLLVETLGGEVAREVQILYGGSMNPKNADELLAQPDIDGGLIGGASLKPDQFLDLIKSGVKAMQS